MAHRSYTYFVNRGTPSIPQDTLQAGYERLGDMITQTLPPGMRAGFLDFGQGRVLYIFMEHEATTSKQDEEYIGQAHILLNKISKMLERDLVIGADVSGLMNHAQGTAHIEKIRRACDIKVFSRCEDPHERDLCVLNATETLLMAHWREEGGENSYDRRTEIYQVLEKVKNGLRRQQEQGPQSKPLRWNWADALINRLLGEPKISATDQAYNRLEAMLNQMALPRGVQASITVRHLAPAIAFEMTTKLRHADDEEEHKARAQPFLDRLMSIWSKAEQGRGEKVSADMYMFDAQKDVRLLITKFSIIPSEEPDSDRPLSMHEREQHFLGWAKALLIQDCQTIKGHPYDIRHAAICEALDDAKTALREARMSKLER